MTVGDSGNGRCCDGVDMVLTRLETRTKESHLFVKIREL